MKAILGGYAHGLRRAGNTDAITPMCQELAATAFALASGYTLFDNAGNAQLDNPTPLSLTRTLWNASAMLDEGRRRKLR